MPNRRETGARLPAQLRHRPPRSRSHGNNLGSANCATASWGPRVTRSLAGGLTLLWPLIGQAGPGPTEPNTLENPIQDSADCATCHNFENAEAHADDPAYAPFRWASTMMGQASIDPVFWAGVALAASDQVEVDETTQCIRCHAPRAFLAGQGDVLALDELDSRHLDGIACDSCHRMIEDPSVPVGNALYVIDDGEDGIVPSYGPWSYTADQIVEHPTASDNPWLADSAMCGTCHDVTTERERLDDDGEGMGVGFNEQRTYSEWLGSSFSQPGAEFRSCIDCHMPAVADVAGCRKFNEQGIFHAEGGRRHDLAGANLFMLQLLRDNSADQGGSNLPDAWFDTSIEHTQAMLASAAELEVEIPDEIDLSRGLDDLAVRVINKSGHKLPTGYSEGRVMWLELTIRYEGELLYSSGLWDPDNAEFPDGIEDDEQVRRYEAIAERLSDHSQLHLLRNDHWVVDNRIPPKGLKKNIESDPVGDRYTAVDGQWPHDDRFSYSFAPLEVEDKNPDSPEDNLAEVRLRLLYLVNTRTYIETLRKDNQINDAGDRLANMFEEAGHAVPVLIASFESEPTLVGFHDPDAETTGASEDSGEDDAGDEADDSTSTEATGSDAESEAEASEDEADDGGTEDGIAEGEADGCACRAPAQTSPGVVHALLGLLR